MPENIHLDTNNPQEGKYSLRIHHPANSHAFPVSDPANPIKTAKGMAYLISFWARAAKHSVDKGLGFRFWEISNEPYTRKATAFQGPDDYAEHMIACSKAIRAVQPDAQIGIAIHSATQGWGNYLLRKAAGHYDFVVAHDEVITRLPIETGANTLKLTVPGNSIVFIRVAAMDKRAVGRE